MVQDNTAAYRRMLVEGVIDRSLRAIQDDPRRGLRKLVDMGAACATGRLQKRFLRMAQDMLENEDSPYYDMVVSAVEAVDHHKIKTFGINFGWNCLTVGAGQIRDYEKAHGHNVPWELTLHIGSGPHDMDAQEYAALLGQAKAPGIYTYFLFPDAGGATIKVCRQGYRFFRPYTKYISRLRVAPNTVVAPSSKMSRCAGESPQSTTCCRKGGQR